MGSVLRDIETFKDDIEIYLKTLYGHYGTALAQNIYRLQELPSRMDTNCKRETERFPNHKSYDYLTMVLIPNLFIVKVFSIRLIKLSKANGIEQRPTYL